MRRILLLILSVAFIMTNACAVENVSSDTVAVKGKYIFVPDSMQNDVIRLLMGTTKVVDDEHKLSADEKTIWKGDTIPMVMKTRNFGRFNRGLSNYLYIPKGSLTFGLTASYGKFSTDDLQIFDVLSDIDVSARIFTVKPYVAYFIKNNMSVGVRFGYSSITGNIDSFVVDFDDDVNFNLHDIMYRNESYTTALTFTQYLGLTRRGRFGIFNEIELAFTAGNSDFNRPYDGVIRKTHSTYQTVGLNFSPGVSVFILKNVSFNVSLGAFGLYLKNEKQTENGESSGNRMTSGANFKLNLFNINFGLGIHL